MRQPSPEAAATFVGVVSLGAGLALIAAPSSAAPLLGVGNAASSVAVGVADVVVGTGLLFGGQRRAWMLARIAVNGAVAARCVSVARGDGPAPGAVRGALVMLLLSAGDARVVRDLP